MVVILVTYICFECPFSGREEAAAPGESIDTLLRPFQSKREKAEISWIMREVGSEGTADEPRSTAFRSVHYRGTFNLRYLSIPPHGAEFFLWFLGDIQERWVELIENAKVHLDKLVNYPTKYQPLATSNGLYY